MFIHKFSDDKKNITTEAFYMFFEDYNISENWKLDFSGDHLSLTHPVCAIQLSKNVTCWMSAGDER